MGSTQKTLIEIKYVTDHDCGNYAIGEIDCWINAELSEYLATYGYKGKQEIVLGLSSAICRVADIWNREFAPKEQCGSESSK